MGVLSGTDEVTRSEMKATASGYLAIGTHVAEYRIESFIDRGGMAFVYEAVDLRLNRRVAFKVLAPQRAGGSEFRERFLRESRFAASLDHPNIVPIYEAGEAGGLLYIAMRYVRGSNLEVVLGNHGSLEPKRALAILTPVGDALDTAHASGLVHRDVKPANILLALPGGEAGHEHVYLSDFGVTKRKSGLSRLTATGNIIGTLAYTAPEQIRGEPVDARSDVYAFGCVAYECLTGVSPFVRSDQAGLLWAHLNEQPAVMSVHRQELVAADPIVARALAKDPSDRFRSCGEFMTALSVALLTCGERVAAPSTEEGSDPATEPGQHARHRAVPRRSAAVVDDGPVPSFGRGPVGLDDGPTNANTVEEGVGGGPSPFTPRPAASLPHGFSVTRSRTRRRTSVAVTAAVIMVVVAAVTTIVAISSGDQPQSAGADATGQASTSSAVEPGSLTQISLSPTSPGAASPPTLVAPDSAVAIPAVDGSPIGVGETPGHVAITPDGRYAYIANRNAAVVTVVDVAIGRVTATIPIAAGPPRYIAITPDGSQAYVSVYDDDETVSVVAVLDTRTKRVLRTIPVGKTPYALAVTPDQQFVYVPSHDAQAVDVISVASNMVVGMVDVPPNPHWVSFAPDGKTAYIADHDSNVVSVLDTSSNKFVRAISVGTSPHSLTVSPDGKQVAVVCFESNDVYLIDSASNTVTGIVPVGTNPQDVAYTPDGRFLYTANVESNTVSVVDVENKIVTAEIPTESPTSIAFLPNGRKAYVTNLNTGTLTVLSTS